MTDPVDLAADPFDVSRAELYAQHAWETPFRHLREHAPVYYCGASKFGPYWSISTYRPIVDIEARPEIFSSSHKYGGSITIAAGYAQAPAAYNPRPTSSFMISDDPP